MGVGAGFVSFMNHAIFLIEARRIGCVFFLYPFLENTIASVIQAACYGIFMPDFKGEMNERDCNCST